MAMAVDDELAVRDGSCRDDPYVGPRMPKRQSPATFGDGLGVMNSDAMSCAVWAFVDRARVEQLNEMKQKLIHVMAQATQMMLENHQIDIDNDDVASGRRDHCGFVCVSFRQLCMG